MAGALQCIDIHPDNHEKTAFATPFSTFQQKCLGFGVTNRPATYCCLVDKVLKHIPLSEALSFIDDSVVHSARFQQHQKSLDKTLKAYQDIGLNWGPRSVLFSTNHLSRAYHR